MVNRDRLSSMRSQVPEAAAILSSITAISASALLPIGKPVRALRANSETITVFDRLHRSAIRRSGRFIFRAPGITRLLRGGVKVETVRPPLRMLVVIRAQGG